MNEKPNVLIVGAGPTGLTMAHELARDGIACRIVDKSAHRATESRAIAIHPRTVETFELMGLAKDFLDAGHRIIAVNIYGEHERIAHVEFAMLATAYRFVLGVPQDETERILEERVAQHGVQVERNTELIAVTQHGSGVHARLRTAGGTEDVEADWLLGCDGAHSTVREQLAIPFSGSTYPEHFVLADVKLAGAVIVSTPQDIALLDARKGLNMFKQVDVPVLGIVENMSYFLCPHCGGRSEIFSHGGAREEARRLGAEFLGEVPLDLQIRETSDGGTPITVADPDNPNAIVFRQMAARVWDKVTGADAGRPPPPRIVIE